MVRIFRIFVVVTLLLVVATPASAKGPAHQVPIKGTVMGEHYEPVFFDPACEPEDPIPDVPWWSLSSDGEWGAGQVSHLGRVEYHLTQCTVPGPEGTRSVGQIQLIAANGDELILRHTMLGEVIGEFPGGEVHGFTFVGTWEADGGTGRFTHATGSGNLYGAGDVFNGEAIFDDIPDGLMQINLVGDIAYKRK